MKKTYFIFVFIFLAGMIFTVFQYVPILEEETPGHKIELTKKAKQGDLADGDEDASDEDCDDDDSQQEFGNYLPTYKTIYTPQTLSFRARNHFYKYLLESKDTPPPKI